MGRDKSWDGYDQDIQGCAMEVNNRFANIAHYRLLDWQIVKALVWTELTGYK